jgi:phage shock protein A
VRPALEKFYESLKDEQKARFSALGPDNSDQQQAQRNLTQVCGERASGIASLPFERIERAVQPDEAQRAGLKGLQDATSEAVNLLRSDLPHCSRAHAGRPPAGDGATPRRDAARGANG